MNQLAKTMEDLAVCGRGQQAAEVIFSENSVYWIDSVRLHFVPALNPDF